MEPCWRAAGGSDPDYQLARRSKLSIFVIKIIQDIAEMLVLNLTGVAMHYHHTGIFTFLGRMLGNEV